MLVILYHATTRFTIVNNPQRGEKDLAGVNFLSEIMKTSWPVQINS